MKRYVWIVLTGVTLIACSKRQTIPDITLLMPDSTGYFNIAKLPPGKPILLLYYQPYCPACRAEWQSIADNMEKFKEVQFCLITDQSYADMMAFYTNYKVKNYPNVLIGRDTGYKFQNAYKPEGVPYNVFFDKKGKFRGGGVMVLNSPQLDSVISAL